VGSNPIASTISFQPRRNVAGDGTLGGLVAAEGSFTAVRQRRPYKDGTRRVKLAFSSTAVRRDPSLLNLRSFLVTSLSSTPSAVAEAAVGAVRHRPGIAARVGAGRGAAITRSHQSCVTSQ
jgi:hypothetical protein